MSGLPIRALGRLTAAVHSRVRTAAGVVQAVRAASARGRYRPPKPELARFPEGHGEQIWVFHHLATNQVVYSHNRVMRNNRALRQLPFNGKKTKPAKLRKDWWRPMALIQFTPGAGAVGQSVFQKLRELRREHELSWGHQADALHGLRDDLAATSAFEVMRVNEKRRMGKRLLGAVLNDQRANSIADMAAVLSGASRGNRVRVVGGDAARGPLPPPDVDLAPATVFWANEYDRNLAEGWSQNVTHAAGLPARLSGPRKLSENTVEPAGA